VRLAYRGRAVDGVSSRGRGRGVALPGLGVGQDVAAELLGFAVPREGAVHVGDRVVSRDGRLLVPPEERGLAVVLQDLGLWPHLTVEGNLGFGLAARGVPAGERNSRIARMLEHKISVASTVGRGRSPTLTVGVPPSDMR
jgi:ABC-type taurine transport system ATPase subunit